jgi:hypothetical protein
LDVLNYPILSEEVIPFAWEDWVMESSFYLMLIQEQ